MSEVLAEWSKRLRSGVPLSAEQRAKLAGYLDALGGGRETYVKRMRREIGNFSVTCPNEFAALIRELTSGNGPGRRETPREIQKLLLAEWLHAKAKRIKRAEFFEQRGGAWRVPGRSGLATNRTLKAAQAKAKRDPEFARDVQAALALLKLIE